MNASFVDSEAHAHPSWRDWSRYETVALPLLPPAPQMFRPHASNNGLQGELHLGHQSQRNDFYLPQPRLFPTVRARPELLNESNQAFGLSSSSSGSMGPPSQTSYVNATGANETSTTLSAGSGIDNRDTAPRRRNISKQLDWDKYQPEIKRRYLDDDMTLADTMRHMKEEFGFVASKKMYKAKIKEWNWPKNLSGQAAHWILIHSQKRKREAKDTVYRLGDHVLSMDQIQKSANRSASRSILRGEDATGAGTTPAGVSYDTPAASTPSPFYTSLEGPTTPPAVDNVNDDDMDYPRFTWNGHTKSYFDELRKVAEHLDHEGQFSEAIAKYREAFDGYRKLFPRVHHETTSLAYHLASLYARTYDMGKADQILEWMTKVHIQYLGLWDPKTVDHLTRVVQMLQIWCRENEAAPLINHLLEGQGHSSPTGFATTAVPVQADNEAMQRQLALTDILDPVEDSIELRLVPLVESCEDQPTEFPSELIQAWTKLIRAYVEMKHEAKKEDAFARAAKSTRTIMKMESGRWSMHMFQSLIRLTRLFIQEGNFEFVDEVLSGLEEKIPDVFGNDHEKTIRVLADIGMLYQQEYRRQDAEPYFQHAQAVAARAYGRKDDRARCFEDARRNGYYQSKPTYPLRT